MNVRKAQKADIDSIEKIYDRIHDSEEQGLSTMAGFAASTPPEKRQKPLWSEAICSSCWMTEM